jgi:hypothetical protein
MRTYCQDCDGPAFYRGVTRYTATHLTGGATVVEILLDDQVYRL